MTTDQHKTSNRPLHWAAAALLAGITCLGSHAALAAGRNTPEGKLATVELAGLQDHFAQVADRVTPSIVAISALGAETAARADMLMGAEVDGPQLAAALDRVSRTVGTGFFIDPEGYILTAEHVISDAQQLWVTTDDKKVYPAMVVGSDPRSDLAVLKIPARGLKAVTFAPADSVRRGQWALTMGNPYGLATGGDLAMSVGVVSAMNRSLPRLSAQENRLYTNLIQSTAEINPGNSGGPLFDLQGRVIGVNAAVVLPQKNTNGIGFSFAITEELLAKVQMLKKGEPIQHAYLGVSVSSAFANSAYGARIDSVLDDGPSSDSGLRVGDVVTRINDSYVSSSDIFAHTVSMLPAGEPANLKVYRNGKTLNLKVTPIHREASAHAVSRANQRLYWGGAVLVPTADHAGYAVKSMASFSPLAGRGIQIGSVITGVEGKPAASLLELLNLLAGSDPATTTLDRQKALAASDAR